MVYSPKVTIRIETSPLSPAKGAVIDVSEDISNWGVDRIENGISTANVTLLNMSRKYDGVFTSMDKIVIYLRRIKNVIKFSGYLDATPLWAAEPGSVSLSASCTLKRLQNFLWDPNTTAGQSLLGAEDPNKVNEQDGGTGKIALDLLTKVARWPDSQVHISRVPDSWYATVSAVADALVAEAEALSMSTTNGPGSWLNGQNPVSGMTNTIATDIQGAGTMPASTGKCSTFGGPGGGAPNGMALTGESGVHPADGWYCAMRFPYVTPFNKKIPGLDVAKAKAWWRNRHIQVVDPATNKTIVVRAADWGPNINTGRVIDLAPNALKMLGASTDDVLHMGFAPEGSKLGLQTQAAADLGTILAANDVGTGGGAQGISSGWGAAGDSSNMTTVTAAGIRFTVNKICTRNFVGFVNELVSSLGYHPKSIGGYNNRNIAGTGTKSNHAYGAAIDIDPDKNPRVTGTAPYALPKPPQIIALARKWGLGWGGEYQNSKDYMHFEVIGAPASNAAAYKNSPTVAGSVSGVVAKWTPPVKVKYVITKHFGDGGKLWTSGKHSGTDFACPSNTPIYPVGPGTVHLNVTGDSSYGNYVTINHGNNIYTAYGHMISQSPIVTGTHVTQDDVIGHVGQTGNATGPHVHLELRRGADTYTAATQSGGIEKYVLGGEARLDPPNGVEPAGGSYEDTLDNTSDSSGLGEDPATGHEGAALFNVFVYEGGSAEDVYESAVLGGYRALMNDVPILSSIGQYLQASLRSYCSAPNGDFIAWFPDYFGHFQQAGKMIVSPLEISLDGGPPTIGQDDTRLKTHQFVTGATAPNLSDSASGAALASTAGIASVEFPELLQALLNISPEEATQIKDTYLSRYGARVNSTTMDSISGHRQEFMLACYLFQQNWSEQFQATVNLTFMPELFPGMLLCLPVYGIQGYIKSTSDSGDFTGGFHTSVSVAPWSSIGGGGAVISGLPVGAPL